MIAKVVLLCTLVAAAHGASIVNSGLLTPGLWRTGIISPGATLLSSPIAAAVPSTIATSSVVATPNAITTDRRIIGTSNLWAGSPLLLSNGIIGASPLAWSNGIVSPIGLTAIRK